MKRNLFAILLAVVLVAAMVFVVAPSAKADVSNIITLDEKGAVTITEENKDKILDLKGYKGATVTFAVTAELQVIDSANTAKDGTTAGSMTIVNNEGVTGTVATVSFDGNVRYLAVNTENTYAFHPFNLAIVRKGVNVKQNSVSLEARFMANDVVARLITELGIYKHEGEKTQGRIPAKESFADGNYVTACYDLIGSLESDEAIQMTRNFSPYIQIEGMEEPVLGAKKSISPVEILSTINDEYAAEKYSLAVKKLANELYTNNAHLQTVISALNPIIKVTLPTVNNGSISLDKAEYKIGDTVTLTINPNSGHFQKLFVNGEPVMLGWRTATYSFVAEKNSYEITGDILKEIGMDSTTWGRWENRNQHHGILTAYYPDNNDSWFIDLKGQHESITVKAKNYFAAADTYEENAANGGFAIVLRATLDNGKNYAFRVWIDKEGRHVYNRFGSGGSATGWGGAWKNLDEVNPDAVAAFYAEGAQFKLTRINANQLQISINGMVLDTYTMEGVTQTNKVVSMGVAHYGNKGEHVDIPFELVERNEPYPAIVNINNIADQTNGTVKPKKDYYYVGDTVELVVTPNNGKYQKLYIDGEPLMLPWKNSTYSFVAEKSSYDITGSFVDGYKGGQAEGKLWDYSNMAHGHLGIYYPNATTTGWKTIDGDYNSYSMVLKDYSNGAQTANSNTEGFTFRTEFTFNVDGTEKKFEFRVIKQNGTFKFQKVGTTAVPGWVTKDFDDAATKAILGDGVELRAERIAGNKIEFFVNGKSVYTYTMEGVTAANPMKKFCMWHNNNKGHYIDLPFKAEKSVIYEESGNLDLSNQNNGIISRGEGDAVVKTHANTYTKASITIKEYTPSKNADGSLKKGDFSSWIAFVFADGKQFQVRVHNTDADGNYKIQIMGNDNNLHLPDSKWKWLADLTAAQKEALLNGDGIKFTVALEGANAVMYIDGKWMATVALGDTYNGQTAQVKLGIQGNKCGHNIEIPFEVN